MNTLKYGCGETDASCNPCKFYTTSKRVQNKPLIMWVNSTFAIFIATEQFMNADQAWQSVLGQLQMEMPRASFDTWVRDTKRVSYQDGTLTVGVRNAYARDWL